MKRFEFDFYQQWTSLFQSCAWYDFTLIKAYFEWERNMGRIELTLALLGLQVSVWYKYEETELERHLIARFNEHMALRQQEKEADEANRAAAGNEPAPAKRGRRVLKTSKPKKARGIKSTSVGARKRRRAVRNGKGGRK